MSACHDPRPGWLPGWLCGDRQVLQAADGVVEVADRLAVQLDRLCVPSERGQDGVAFDAGERLTGAGVDAAAEGEVVGGVALDVEAVWVGVFAFVAVRRAKSRFAEPNSTMTRSPRAMGIPLMVVSRVAPRQKKDTGDSSRRVSVRTARASE